MKKKILIASFYFPPYPKVGSRRWAKFSKYLDKSGHNVNVICLTFKQDTKSPWDKDVKHLEHKIHRIKKNYGVPLYRQHISNNCSTFYKIRWKCSLLWNQFSNRFLSKGNYCDPSIDYTNDFFHEAKSLLLKNKYDTFIVTGGPFRYCYVLSKLKKRFPSVNFILDLRDFWSDWMFHLNSNQKKHELLLEAKTISSFDKVVTPAERITNRLKEKYPKHQCIQTIPHAYDNDELPTDKNGLSPQGEIKMIYAGSLYPNMETNIVLIKKLIKIFKKREIKVSLDIFAPHQNYRELMNDEITQGSVNYKPIIGPTELFKKIKSEYDIVIYQRSNLNFDHHFKSTKFYEFIALQKPLLFIGKEGDISEYLVSNKLGFHLVDTNIEATVSDILENKKTANIPNCNFDVESYSFEAVTKQLERLL